MTIIQELHRQGIRLEAIGDRLRLKGPAHLLTAELRAEVAAHKPEILAQLIGEMAGTLEWAIRFARSEPELDRLTMEIQSSFEAGHLTQSQAERLTYLSIEIARQLEHGLVNVPMGPSWGTTQKLETGNDHKGG